MTDFDNNQNQQSPFITDSDLAAAGAPDASAPVLTDPGNLNTLLGPNQGVPPPIATAPDAGVTGSTPATAAPPPAAATPAPRGVGAGFKYAATGGEGPSPTGSGSLLGRILFGALDGAVKGAGATQPGVRGGAAFGAGVRAAYGTDPKQQELQIAKQKAQTERAVALSTIQKNLASTTYWASKQAALEESRERLAHPGFTPAQAASATAEDLRMGVLSHITPVGEISAAPAAPAPTSDPSDAADAAAESTE